MHLPPPLILLLLILSFFPKNVNFPCIFNVYNSLYASSLFFQNNRSLIKVIYFINYFFQASLNCSSAKNAKKVRPFWQNKTGILRNVPIIPVFFILRILYSVSLLIEILIVVQFLVQLLQRLRLTYLQMQYLDL